MIRRSHDIEMLQNTLEWAFEDAFHPQAITCVKERGYRDITRFLSQVPIRAFRQENVPIV